MLNNWDDPFAQFDNTTSNTANAVAAQAPVIQDHETIVSETIVSENCYYH